MTNETTDSNDDSLQPIPDEQQEISTEEIIDADYDVLPSSAIETDETDQKRMSWGRHLPPGRMWNDDSIDASTEDDDRTEEGYSFSAGYDSGMATRIGDETKDDPEADKLRKYHEGRHRSDGQHSTRESRRDKQRIPQAICSALPLADYERVKVIHVVAQLDFSRFGHQKSLVGVTLGVVAVVIDERLRDPDLGAEPKECGLVRWTDEFRQTCTANDVSMSDLSTIKEIVREAIDDGDVTIPAGEPLPRRDPQLPGPTPRGELPDEYWERKTPEYWVSLAKQWHRRTEERKEGFPEEYLELIRLLRTWEPWDDEDDPSADILHEGDPDDQDIKDAVSEDEVAAALWEIDEEVEEEARKLVEEMEGGIAE